MSDLNTQSAAVIEAEQNTTSTQEAVVQSMPISAETRTLEESLSDVAVTGFTAAAAVDVVEGVPEEEPASAVFLGHTDTNVVVHRRKNPDNSHEFILTNENSDWLHKSDKFTSGTPIGDEATTSLLQLLADETQEYFTVLDSDGDKASLGDDGDIRNLTRLQAFAEDVGLVPLFISGIRSIHAGSRLLEKAISTDSKYINGAMTIAYQVPGQEGTMKYRLVGEINREFVLKIVEVAGELATEVIRKIEPKAKKNKTKTEAVVNKAEQVIAQPEQQVAQVKMLGKELAKHQHNAPRAGAQTDALLRRVIDMVEILVVDNRDIRQQLNVAQGFNQALQREVHDYRNVSKELVSVNKNLMETLSTILDTLNK